MQSEMPRTKIFVSYSHKDREYLERLRVHFSSLKREGNVEFWADTQIEPGDRWKDEIKKALDGAAVAILLISADFLDSDFIIEHELPKLLAAEEKRGLTILPLHIAPSDYENTDLTDIQGINNPTNPIAGMSWTQREIVYLKLVKKIRAILDENLLRIESDAKVHRASDQNLLEFPRDILKKKNLTTLFLSGNQLSELPDELETLDKLSTLYLNRNQFREFPMVINRLPRLTELYFSDNQLKYVPSSILNLKRLKMLRLSGNQLKHIPSEFGRMKTLAELYLSNNRLQSIPSELGSLTTLRQLDISNNELDALPPALSNLASLSRLIVHGNAFSENRDLKKFVNEPGKIFDIIFQRNNDQALH